MNTLRVFTQRLALCFGLLMIQLFALPVAAADRPNILFFFADDWGRYASVYADSDQPSLNDVIQTPNMDRIANEGVLFRNAFVPVASCGPIRSSLATGRHFWNCGSGAFLNGKASNWKGQDNPFVSLPKFVDLLKESGYYTARSGKTFAFTPSKAGPGAREVPKVAYHRYGQYVSGAANDAERKQRHEETIAHPRSEMRRVIKSRDKNTPFFFVYGTINTHRPYVADSGQKLWGIDPDRLKRLLPRFLPDVADVRRDFADYLGEVLALDAMLGVMLKELEEAGELDNTLVILSGDHGIPGVPRGKTNCYDLSTRVSLMARLPKMIKAGRTVDDFISIMDVGPMLLDLAGVEVPESMDGRSFKQQLVSTKSGWVDPDRNQVVIGRELHFHSAREGNLPYPMRAVRTPEFLYISNFKPDRWPMGTPHGLDENGKLTYEQLHKSTAVTMYDLDASLTKAWMFTHRDAPDVRPMFDMTVGLRPAEELYDLRNDPDQLKNLASDPTYAEAKAKLSHQITSIMAKTNDPRLTDAFDRLPYVDPKLVGVEPAPRVRRKK
jgi:N-sulfoglucosamine sulfohydrolase